MGEWGREVEGGGSALRAMGAAWRCYLLGKAAPPPSPICRSRQAHHASRCLCPRKTPAIQSRQWSNTSKQTTQPDGGPRPKCDAPHLHSPSPLSQKLPLLLFRMLTNGRCGRPLVSGKPRSSGGQRAQARMRAGLRRLTPVHTTPPQDVEGGRDGGRLLRGAGRCGRPTTRQAADGTTTLGGRQPGGAQHKPSTQRRMTVDLAAHTPKPGKFHPIDLRQYPLPPPPLLFRQRPPVRFGAPP